MPLRTRFVPFAEGLLKALPEILGLPMSERLVLVLAGALHHTDVYDPTQMLRGVPKLRALGRTYKTWCYLGFES